MAVTNATIANLPFMGVLPMGVTHIGGDTQLFTVRPYEPSNTSVFFNQVAQESWGIPGITYQGASDVSPYQPNPQQTQDLANQFLAPVYGNSRVADLNAAASTVSSTLARLNAVLADPNLDANVQSQIRGHISTLEGIGQQISNFQPSQDPIADAQRAASLRNQATTASKAALDYLNSLVTPQGINTSQGTVTVNGQQIDLSNVSTAELMAIIAKLLDALQQQQNNPSTTNTSTTNDSTTNNSTTNTNTTNTVNNNKTVDNVNTFAPEYRDFVSDFHDAIDGWGTDNEAMTNLLDQIDETNVMEVMLAYNKYQSGRDGESFMEAFMWDATHGQKSQYGKQIADALREKAEECGVYDEVAADFDTIYDEVDDWFEISNDISANYDHIVAVIAEHMGSRYGNARA